MNKFYKALFAGALALMAAGTAGAHGTVRVYTEMRPYHPAAVQRHYVPVHAYHQDRFVYVEPAWEARRDWRREQWRREQWRRDHWRHAHRGHDRCRHHQHWR